MSKKVVTDDGVYFNSPSDEAVIFSALTEEIDRLIFQMGTADADLASQAASRVIEYVGGIDVNMGCPKHFSTHCGMGAGLLRTPDKSVDILKALRLVVPPHKSLSCKIRLIGDLEDPASVIEKTSEYICRMYAAGADAVTLHMRTTPQRPREKANWHLFGPVHLRVKERLEGKEFVLIPNGDFYTAGDIKRFEALMNAVDPGWCKSYMIARGALRSPAVFALNPARSVDPYIPKGSSPVCPDFCSMLTSIVDSYEKQSEPYQAAKWIVTRVISENSVSDAHKEFNSSEPKSWTVPCAVRKDALAAVCASKSYEDVRHSIEVVRSSHHQ